MKNPYKLNKPKKRQMTSYDLKRPQMTSKEPVIDHVKSNGKNYMKGVNPNDDNPAQGSIFIDQAFSSK